MCSGLRRPGDSAAAAFGTGGNRPPESGRLFGKPGVAGPAKDHAATRRFYRLSDYPFPSRGTIGKTLIYAFRNPDGGFIRGQSHGLACPAQEAGIRFSSDIAGFQFVARKDFEPQDPGLGVGLTYRHGSLILASVYLYTAGAEHISDGISSPEMREELGRVNEDIFKTPKQMRYRNFKSMREESVVYFGDVSYLSSDHSYDAPGKNPETFVVGFFITGLNRHFVKTRFTYLRNKQNDALPQRDAFLAEISKRMNREN